MEQGLVIFGVGLSVVALAVILWSIAFPSRRIWPPGQSGPIVLMFVWLPTLALFAVLITLGVLDWGEIALPMWLRFGVGPSLIAVGNLAVWHEVRKFGLDQTSGAKGSLRTDDLYRFSRHPQYVADALIVIGWLVLSASIVAIPVGLGVLLLLFTAPIAEEPWLGEVYGDEYNDYARHVRRYL